MAYQNPTQSALPPGAAAQPGNLSGQANLRPPSNSAAAQAGAAAGLVPAEPGPGIRGDGNAADLPGGKQAGLMTLTAACARIPVSLSVSVPVRDFRVRQLLAMAPGQVIRTGWANGEDLPLTSGDVQLAWTEFEVIDSQLAVRITRLA